MSDVTVWLDGFGIWHAKVRGEKFAQARETAKLAISEALAERGSLLQGGITIVAGGPSEGWYEFEEADA